MVQLAQRGLSCVSLLTVPCPPSAAGLCLAPHGLLFEGYNDTVKKIACAEGGPKQVDPGFIFIVSVKVFRCQYSLPLALLSHCEEHHPSLFPLCSEQAGLYPLTQDG